MKWLKLAENVLAWVMILMACFLASMIIFTLMQISSERG